MKKEGEEKMKKGEREGGWKSQSLEKETVTHVNANNSWKALVWYI